LQLAAAVDGTTDDDQVQQACEDAGDLVDGYLRRRYSLPLSAVPSILVRMSAAIARHYLHLGGDRQPTDQVKAGHDAAVAFLKDVAAGRADLGIDVAGAEPVQDSRGIVAGPGEARSVTTADLDDYRRGLWR
jgi:phage gp36-like protein